jgi:cytochrome P450
MTLPEQALIDWDIAGGSRVDTGGRMERQRGRRPTFWPDELRVQATWAFRQPGSWLGDEAGAVVSSRMTGATDLYYDPFDYEIDANAHAVWQRLRDEAPLYRNDKYDFWALSRYDDVLEAIVDTERFSSAHGTTLDMMSPDLFPISMLIFMDPPPHSWHRKVVNRAFTPRKIAGLEQRVITICQNLLDQLEGRSEFDFVQEYAAIIPPTMIMTLVGFPEDMIEEWRQGLDNMLTVTPEGTIGEERSTAMGDMESL